MLKYKNIIKQLLPAWVNEDDGCQIAEDAVKGMHFPPVRAWDNLRRRGVSAKPVSNTTMKQTVSEIIKPNRNH